MIVTTGIGILIALYFQSIMWIPTLIVNLIWASLVTFNETYKIDPL